MFLQQFIACIALSIIGSTLAYAFPPLKLAVLDVGEGQAVVLQRATRGILIDTGNLGQTAGVLRKLKQMHIKTLDALILTHLHPDHSSGYFRVLEAFPKIKVYESCHPQDLKTRGATDSTTRWVAQALLTNKNRECVKVGDSIPWSGIALKVLWPVKPEGADLNLHSLVLQIDVAGKTALIMGDATKLTEQELLKTTTLADKVDLYVVGHHGASDATSEEFISRLKPELSVISVNKNNFWGSPAKETVDLLRKYSKHLEITGESGDICRVFDAKKTSLIACDAAK